MANITRTFVQGKMNKVVDERLLPEGQYIDAMNIRMGSTENAEVGVIENTKGNLPLTRLRYINGTELSLDARCIGAIEDSANETLYWFVHDPNFTVGLTGKLDLVVSYNISTDTLTYHVVSINDGSNVNTTLNFNPQYLITGVNIIGDLLFFTDNYNQPRVINVKRTYPTPLSNIDRVTAESLLVIKKPPIESPVVTPYLTSGQENFLDTRFISFAYRYRYIDNEYSATSQWSEPAFVPKPFSINTASYLNDGMTNAFNAARIKYNSGGPLVVGIDLLFKDANGNIIKIIEKLDKKDLGLANNTEYEYEFVNSKIFTILPDSELLRLYDNVPIAAKAQTIMGNRLMYGNYTEGYDLIDNSGQNIKLEYFTELISIPIGNTDLTDSTSDGDYTIDNNITVNVNDAIVSIDLAGKDLKEGSAINLDVRITHAEFSGSGTIPAEETNDVSLSMAFFLNKDYASVYELATSEEFQTYIGTIDNISTVADSCNGVTFTDMFNCRIPNQLNDYEKTASGITAQGQPIKVVASPASTIISFQFPAMKFVDSVASPPETIYEYYSVTFAQATFQDIANTRSLHSNRDYEIGIVYMDDYNRASTALVSKYNTEHVPCGNSASQNKIEVTIPPTQRPPYWATRYKFVIKPNEEGYETIYSSIYFEDPETNAAYFLLEGENARKVEVGDQLIVKADSDGPSDTCAYATVLEKESKASNFIEIPSELDPTVNIPIPAGVYMKINANSFSIVRDELAVIAPGKVRLRATDSDVIPKLYYPMNRYDANANTWVDYDIPAGSKIIFTINQWRDGVGGLCEQRTSSIDKVLTAKNTYDNMYDWFVGDDIELVLKNATTYAGGNNCQPTNEFVTGITNNPNDIPGDACINYYRFYRNTTTNQLQLIVTSTYPCAGGNYPNSRASNIEVNITVFRADNTIIFETEPTPALPDVFYENDLSFAITNGNHMGNVQNQTTTLPAIVDTGFFNCYAFGNGVESYKIRDSILGQSFRLGNRVTSVSEQIYKRADRFADITYSGVFNPESNVNKLNVFNLGLLNYKNLEVSFGPIQIIDGRQTDVLVLQEDKVSYVLADKNLLSDSAGGSAVTSVPEVLGTQIARTEKYGISFNPESYVQWGYDRFFTDAKRGAVIQLRGDSYSQDQLQVVSEFDMRTWFRDLFNSSFDTQKLGGYDPYMNEYVLVSNEIKLPKTNECLQCGINQTFTLSTINLLGEEKSYCVELGSTVGTVGLNYNINSLSAEGMINVKVNYNGSESESGWVTTSGTLNFNKNSITETSVLVTIEYKGVVSLDVYVDCVDSKVLNVIQIVLTNGSEAGDSIHTEYRYYEEEFISPLQSSLVTFADGTENPIVSRYNLTSDQVGTGGIPPEGSNVVMATNKKQDDTFVFDPASDSFKYAMTDTLYSNNQSDIVSLLGIASTATPNEGSGNYNYATLTVPTLQDYLYLIWDFRTVNETELCYSSTTYLDSCSCGVG